MATTSFLAVIITKHNYTIPSATHLQPSTKHLSLSLPLLTLKNPSPLKHPNLLLPNDLRKKCPADIGMHLSFSYLHAQIPQTAHFLALDVTIPALPSPSDAQPTLATATIKHHHKAEKAKFEINGSRMSIQVFQDHINQQILLLLVTIDHLSGLGTLAYHLLLGG